MIRALLKSLVRGTPLIAIDYPLNPVPRWGFGRPTHPRLTSLIASGKDRYEGLLQQLRQFAEDFRAIPERSADPAQPSRVNAYFEGLDALSLYGLLRLRAPQNYIEIGSGNSTRFAARAIRDGALRTRIVSIDPNPRVEMDSLAHHIWSEQQLRDRVQDVCGSGGSSFWFET